MKQALNESEQAALTKQIWDLRVMHSQFTHSDDKRRMVDAADSLESLLETIRELSNEQKK